MTRQSKHYPKIINILCEQAVENETSEKIYVCAY